MNQPAPMFEIHESGLDGRLELILTGELDLVSSRVLEDRLARLRAVKTPVSLDLSGLDFIDSTGIRLLIQTIGDARLKRWDVRIEPDVSPQVMRLLRLVRLDDFVLDSARELRPTGRGRLRPAS